MFSKPVYARVLYIHRWGIMKYDFSVCVYVYHILCCVLRVTCHFEQFINLPSGNIDKLRRLNRSSEKCMILFMSPLHNGWICDLSTNIICNDKQYIQFCLSVAVSSEKTWCVMYTFTAVQKLTSHRGSS